MANNINDNQFKSIRRNSRPISEINVTPFVDVMLVLLVIFMVTAPLLTVGVEVELPKTKSSVIGGSDEPLSISIDAGGVIFIQDTEVKLRSLVARLDAITQENRDIRIFIRGDQSINYGRVLSVMGLIKSAGYRKIALLTRRLDRPSTIVKGNQ